MIDMVLFSNSIQVFNTKKVLRLSNLAIDLKETRFLMKKKKKTLGMVTSCMVDNNTMMTQEVYWT